MEKKIDYQIRMPSIRKKAIRSKLQSYPIRGQILIECAILFLVLVTIGLTCHKIGKTLQEQLKKPTPKRFFHVYL